MKKFLSYLAVLNIFFFSGCSYKVTSINVEPYKVHFLTFRTQKTSIYINKIEDLRGNPNIIAYITNSKGDNLGYKTTTTNFSSWYEDALKKALKANGFRLAKSSKKADFAIDLKIKKIMVTFNKDVLTKENLKGTISLKMMLKNRNELITKNISENISKYNGISISDDSIKKEINALLNDSIKLIVKNISDNS